ncbi:MAG: N-acetyltransferase [Acidobacteria bacterium]|nr:MAG: N-acetyltransferase [Acidobacteriota bacterium]
MIDPSAVLAPGVSVDHGAVIGPGVVIGEGTVIGCHVVVREGTRIGRGVRIDDHAVLGKLPMRAAASAITRERELPPLEIGDGCLVGAGAVIYRGARIAGQVMIADLATVREDVSIGERTIVGRGVTIENRVTIGPRCKIETEAYITALSEIGEGCFIAPSVCFTNDNFLGRTKERFRHHKGVTLERGARVGANVTCLPGITIGADALVAAGAIVTRDVPARMIVMGQPARPVRPVPEEQLLDNQEP